MTKRQIEAKLKIARRRFPVEMQRPLREMKNAEITEMHELFGEFATLRFKNGCSGRREMSEGRWAAILTGNTGADLILFFESEKDAIEFKLRFG